MRLVALLLICLFFGLHQAKAENTWIRNDNASTIVIPNNQQAGLAAVNQYGVPFTEGANRAATFTSEVVVAYGDIGSSYAAALTNSNNLTLCILSNLTNNYISFDNGTSPIISSLPAGTIYVADFGSSGRWVNTNIRIKYSGSAPSAGNVYINCYY